MTQDWREVVPDNRLANEAVYDEWLAKPSWTLGEAAYLIVGLDPSKISHPWEGFPAEEYGKVVDTLRRAVGARGKQGIVPISGKGEGDWRFKPIVIIKNAKYYKLEVPDVLLKHVSKTEAEPDGSHRNAVRYAKEREEILMAGLAALAYWPESFRTNEGRIIYKQLAEFLEDSWPEEGAPQEAEAMAQLFSKALIFGEWTNPNSNETN